MPRRTSSLFRHAVGSSAAVLLLVAALLTTAACDSGPEPRPGDVAGSYDFEELLFDITAPGFPDVNVLDTLRTSELVLRSGGRFTLYYQFRGQSRTEVVEGNFSVSAGRVRLNASEEDAAFFSDILLPTEITLQREEAGLLRARIPRTVDLEAYAPRRYPGVRSIDGSLHIRLIERTR